jgi:aryl-alcohol dehydrogenase-like predicted oxidoreductase
VIPGFKNVKQVEDNLGALEVPGFTAQELTRLQEFYVKEVHANIRGAY